MPDLRAVQTTTTASAGGATDRVIGQIRQMLTTMQLLPGQAIRQESLAAELSVGRASVREALLRLRTEGVLDYQRNVGYTVKRLTRAEFDQTYLMRKALESELFRRLPDPFPQNVLDELRELNLALGRCESVVELCRCNTEFHFAIFRASGLDLVVQELAQIWAMTDSYRAVYFYDPMARERSIVEHHEIIDLLVIGDYEDLCRVMDQHRSQLSPQLGAMLSQ